MNGGRFGSPSRTQGMSDVLDAVISVETGFKKLVAYERPLRSLLALFAWITIVQRPVRLVGSAASRFAGHKYGTILADSFV